MKKISLFLLAAVLLICVACAALADVKPGEEVTVTLSLSNTNAAYVRVVASYDKSVFDLVGYSANSGTAGSNGIVMYDTGVLPSGAVGTVTLKVKDGAAPGTYTVGASLAECYDINENNGSASVSGGSVTVAGNETPAPTPAPTDAPTSAPTEAPTEEPTAVPTDVPGATEEPTPAPSEVPTEAPITDPTEAPVDNKPQYSFSGVTYNGKNFSGKLVHAEGTGTAEKLRVRVTFFIAGNYYMATSADVEEDGSFELDAVGPIEYITAVAYDRAGDGSRFGATDLTVY